MNPERVETELRHGRGTQLIDKKGKCTKTAKFCFMHSAKPPGRDPSFPTVCADKPAVVVIVVCVVVAVVVVANIQ